MGELESLHVNDRDWRKPPQIHPFGRDLKIFSFRAVGLSIWCVNEKTKWWTTYNYGNNLLHLPLRSSPHLKMSFFCRVVLKPPKLLSQHLGCLGILSTMSAYVFTWMLLLAFLLASSLFSPSSLHIHMPIQCIAISILHNCHIVIAWNDTAYITIKLC